MAIAGGSSSVPDSADRRIAKLASAQHGVFSRAQARGLGLGNGMLQQRLATGRWDRLHPGVYRLAGTARTWRQTLMALCLAWGPGSVVSHFASAALWALAGFDPGPPELIVPRGRERALPGTVHRPRSLPPADVTRLEGIPVTTVTRTLLDIAAVADPERVEVALDDALRRKLVSLPRLASYIRDGARERRPGIALLRRLVEARSNASPVPQSVFETKLLRALKRGGLPDPVRQHEIWDEARLIAVVDFAYPEMRLAIEADGYRWHSGRLRWQQDLARRNGLTALGWRVLHVTWADLVDRRDQTIRAIAQMAPER